MRILKPKKVWVARDGANGPFASQGYTLHAKRPILGNSGRWYSSGECVWLDCDAEAMLPIRLNPGECVRVELAFREIE
jgi:hypothetical protein